MNITSLIQYLVVVKPCLRDMDIEITTSFLLEKHDNLQDVYQNPKHLAPHVGIYIQ